MKIPSEKDRMHLMMKMQKYVGISLDECRHFLSINNWDYDKAVNHYKSRKW